MMARNACQNITWPSVDLFKECVGENAGKKGLRWDTVDPCKHYKYSVNNKIVQQRGRETQYGFMSPKIISI